jgi:MoaA/NifB/PqqE/SkfB family radical SAM enzyme
MFCLSPWNSFDDMVFVINVAKHYGIDVRIGIYGTMAFFDTTNELLTASDFVKQIPQSIHDTQENYDFVALYDEWLGGHLRLRCQSIMSCLVVHSNGDVPLCQNLDVVLGNIHEQSLDEIFNGATARQTQCHYSRHCNNCWINFHRKYDIILVRNFERLLPKWLIEKFYGPYQWTADPKQTYRKHLNAIQ